MINCDAFRSKQTLQWSLLTSLYVSTALFPHSVTISRESRWFILTPLSGKFTSVNPCWALWWQTDGFVLPGCSSAAPGSSTLTLRYSLHLAESQSCWERLYLHTSPPAQGSTNKGWNTSGLKSTTDGYVYIQCDTHPQFKAIVQNFYISMNVR